MARKRLVSPKFFTHPELYDAEVSSGLPLRLAYEALWCQADRRGLFAWRPRELKLQCLPYDPVDFAEVLDALERHEFLRSYVVDGKRYGHLPTLKNHQTFHHAEKPDLSIPVPPPAAPVPAEGAPDNGTHPPPTQPGASPRPALGNAGADAVPAQRLSVTVTDTVTSTIASTDTGTATDIGSHQGKTYSELGWRGMGQKLVAAGQPHEAAALYLLVKGHPQPAAVVCELYALATGKHPVRGKTTGRLADIADVMRAVAEFATKGKPFDVPYFRGFLRRVIDRPPEPATAEERQAAKIQAELDKLAALEPTRGERDETGFIVPVPIAGDETDEARERRRRATAEAMANFRAIARGNVPPSPSTDSP